MIAARLGQVIAVVFILGSFFWGFTLALIGVFVFYMAAQENRMVQFQHVLQTYKVEEVMRTDFTILPMNVSVGEVEEMVRHGLEKNFLVMSTAEPTINYLSQQAFYQALKLKQFTKLIGGIAQPVPARLHPADSLESVYLKMQTHKLNILPVFDAAKELVGVVDISSLNHFLHRLKK